MTGQFILMSKQEKKHTNCCYSVIWERRPYFQFLQFLTKCYTSDLTYQLENCSYLNHFHLLAPGHLFSPPKFLALILFKLPTFPCLCVDFIFGMSWDLSEAALTWCLTFMRVWHWVWPFDIFGRTFQMSLLECWEDLLLPMAPFFPAHFSLT